MSNLIKITGKLLTGIEYELSTGYDNDAFQLFAVKYKNSALFLQLSEDYDLDVHNEYIVSPELAISIYRQVKALGEDKVKENYNRYKVINSASYDYNGNTIHPLIKQWVMDGKLDDKTAEEIADMSDEMYAHTK